MKLRYLRSDQKLRIEDATTGQLMWEGMLEGLPVQKVAEIPCSNDCIVLLDPGTGSMASMNLWRYSYENGVVWMAKLPSNAGDAYIDFELENARVFANSWTGFRVEIDLATGHILHVYFTK